jgi:hypothetical protein
VTTRGGGSDGLDGVGQFVRSAPGCRGPVRGTACPFSRSTSHQKPGRPEELRCPRCEVETIEPDGCGAARMEARRSSCRFPQLAIEVPGLLGDEAWNGAVLRHGANQISLFPMTEQVVGVHGRSPPLCLPGEPEQALKARSKTLCLLSKAELRGSPRRRPALAHQNYRPALVRAFAHSLLFASRKEVFYFFVGAQGSVSRGGPQVPVTKHKAAHKRSHKAPG